MTPERCQCEDAFCLDGCAAAPVRAVPLLYGSFYLCRECIAHGHMTDRRAPIPALDPRLVTRELDPDGTSWPPHIARQRGLALPAVAFIRCDGWVLGCAAELEADARAIWPAMWHFRAAADDGWRLREVRR